MTTWYKSILLTVCVSAMNFVSADCLFKPRALEKGDLIALVFPATYLDVDDLESGALENIKATLEQRGFAVKYYPEQSSPFGYLSDTDKNRAAALMEAWRDPEVKAIWCCRGGFGSCLTLDYLDFTYMQENTKIFIGMSDITAIHVALQKHGLVTFLGPVLNYFNSAEFDVEYALTSMENCLVNTDTSISIPGEMEIDVLSEGVASGELVGGNLTLLSSLCGTKWQLNTKDKVLLIEEIGEYHYRIDRMLWQLKEAGLFRDVKGVILASFDGCKAKIGESSLRDIFDKYFKNAPFPVLYQFPSGHISTQAMLPLNIEVEIDTSQKNITYLDTPFSG